MRRTAMLLIALGFLGCEGQGSIMDPEGSSNLPQTGSNNGGTTGVVVPETPDPFPEIPCAGLACETPVPSVTPRVTRLTHHQWENAVRDLLRLPERTGLSSTFLPDTLNTGAFDRMAESLDVTPGLWEDYREAAETLAAGVVADPAALAQLVPAGAPEDLEGRSRAFVESFGPRAYRRPLTPDEVDAIVAQMAQAPELFGGGESFERSVEIALRSFLQSPHFLYRVETHDVAGAQIVALNGWERASRLSFALWNTIPDDELLAAAGRGDLDDHAKLVLQVERMLEDDKARDVVADFHAQLLGFDHFREMTKAEELFPSFTEGTRASMQRELELFIDDVVYATDGTYRELMTSTHSFVDPELAPIYGVDAPAEAFERVELDPVQRPGVLTRSGFLALNATAYDPNPIHRGVFINEKVLCLTLPPPPDNFSIPDGVEGNTNRERIENATGQCGGACHTPLINPPGFAFENYDAVGGWRSMDGSFPVDATGELTFDGRNRVWENGAELVRLLAESPQAHACYVSQWFEYLNGREAAAGDEPLVARLAQASHEGDVKVKELLVAIVSSSVFLSRDSGREQ